VLLANEGFARTRGAQWHLLSASNLLARAAMTKEKS
jgi:hypothetical protein